MFGFGDLWVPIAYILCLGSAALCVIYGWRHWNEGDDMPSPVHPADEDLEFDEEV